MTKNAKILALADLFLAAMPERHMVRWCPEDYGPIITDDHRLFCWNEVVDVYELFPDEEINSLYEKHVTLGEDMRADVEAELNMEEGLMLIVNAALEEAESGSVTVLRVSRDEDGSFRRLETPEVVDKRLTSLARPLNREDMN